MLPAGFVCVGCNYANVFFSEGKISAYICIAALSWPSVPIVNLSQLEGKNMRYLRQENYRGICRKIYYDKS